MIYKGYTIETEYGFFGFQAHYYKDDPDNGYSTSINRMDKKDSIQDAKRQIDKIEWAENETAA